MIKGRGLSSEKPPPERDGTPRGKRPTSRNTPSAQPPAGIPFQLPTASHQPRPHPAANHQPGSHPSVSRRHSRGFYFAIVSSITSARRRIPSRMVSSSALVKFRRMVLRLPGSV